MRLSSIQPSKDLISFCFENEEERDEVKEN
jgi:hypothetical protein